MLSLKGLLTLIQRQSDKEGGRDRERSSTCWFTPQMLIMPRDWLGLELGAEKLLQLPQPLEPTPVAPYGWYQEEVGTGSGTKTMTLDKDAFLASSLVGTSLYLGSLTQRTVLNHGQDRSHCDTAGRKTRLF